MLQSYIMTLSYLEANLIERFFYLSVYKINIANDMMSFQIRFEKFIWTIKIQARM